MNQLNNNNNNNKMSMWLMQVRILVTNTPKASALCFFSPNLKTFQNTIFFPINQTFLYVTGNN